MSKYTELAEQVEQIRRDLQHVKLDKRIFDAYESLSPRASKRVVDALIKQVEELQRRLIEPEPSLGSVVTIRHDDGSEDAFMRVKDGWITYANCVPRDWEWITKGYYEVIYIA